MPDRRKVCGFLPALMLGPALGLPVQMMMAQDARPLPEITTDWTLFRGNADETGFGRGYRRVGPALRG